MYTLAKSINALVQLSLFQIDNIILMGGQQSKKRDETLAIVKEYQLEKKNCISEKEFTDEIFRILDNNHSHTKAGPLIVTGSYLLKAFYNLLKDQRKGTLPKDKFIDVIEDMYKKPEKAIEYSHKMVASNRQRISKRDFSEFISNCLTHGISAVQRHNKFDTIFAQSFKEWMDANSAYLIKGIDEVFDSVKQSSQEHWGVGDFKRWVMDNNHWTLYIKIKSNVYKIPLNLPCLFGISLVVEKD